MGHALVLCPLEKRVVVVVKGCSAVCAHGMDDPIGWVITQGLFADDGVRNTHDVSPIPMLSS